MLRFLQRGLVVALGTVLGLLTAGALRSAPARAIDCETVLPEGATPTRTVVPADDEEFWDETVSFWMSADHFSAGYSAWEMIPREEQ